MSDGPADNVHRLKPRLVQTSPEFSASDILDAAKAEPEIESIIVIGLTADGSMFVRSGSREGSSAGDLLLILELAKNIILFGDD